MLGRYLGYDFGSNSGGEDEATVVPQVTLHHGITWTDLARDSEPNEYRLDLERDTGEWPAGVHTPYRRHGEGLDLDEALAFVEIRVEELCHRHEDAARPGLAPR
ncbi:hypothetical protein [Streptomyces sp. NPDC088794]|jgi:hypothetical protein|uniref:hypothetical protein n=1 Tax=Streptomyces sp. NPDC088794 TaxID=3365902 RepID=UPI0037F7F83A